MRSISAASASKACRFLIEIREAVVGRAHAGERVAQTHLGDVGADAGARQQRSGRPSQVVQNVIADAAGLVDGFLAPVKVAERAAPSTRENKIAEHRLRRDDLLRRRAQWNHNVLPLL